MSFELIILANKVVCDGYPSRDKTASNRALPVLAPAATSPETSLGCSDILPKQTSPSQDALRILMSPNRFENENESRFYGFYLQEVARVIAGPIPFEDKISLWSHLIPQACETEPYIKQLVVSLGALGQVARTQSLPIDRWGLQKSHHFALDEYAK